MIARDPTSPLARLTRKERAYLEAACRDGGIIEAAPALGVPDHAVRKTLARGYRRGGCHGLAHGCYLLGLEEGRAWRAERTPTEDGR